VQVSARGSELLEQARHLRDDQGGRLSTNARFAFKRFRRLGLGDLAVHAAESQNAYRAGIAREAAIAAARSAIEMQGVIAQYRGLLGEAQRAVGDAIRSPAEGGTDDFKVALVAVEWAILALVAEAWITHGQFAALYGPWWRAVVTDTEAVWYARWSALSLAGFWLTMVGVVFAAVVNQGAAGFLSLGLIATGVAGLAAGAIFGATHSVPWPEPTRSASVSLVLRSGGQGFFYRVWRLPERVAGRLTTAFRRSA
jgi:hypothetical protein